MGRAKPMGIRGKYQLFSAPRRGQPGFPLRRSRPVKPLQPGQASSFCQGPWSIIFGRWECFRRDCSDSIYRCPQWAPCQGTICERRVFNSLRYCFDGSKAYTLVIG